MRIIIHNAKKIISPTTAISSTTPDDSAIYIDGDRISAPFDKSLADRVIDASGCVVMTGGVDLHTHIGGGKANLARLLLYERERPIRPKFASDATPSLSSPVPSTVEAGLRYLQLGYPTCIEPAVVASGARQAHCEMVDTPFVNTGGYLVLGNEELLLHWLSENLNDSELEHYIAWMLRATQCMAVKVVNAGGISAFKYNQRAMDVDTPHAHWHITPRLILRRLAGAIDNLRLPHPLHVHCSNLGTRGNITTTLATIDAVEGHRLHITHAQFHAYGSEGPFRYSSAARQLADRVNRQPELSIDVGQVLFGQTVTLSADTMHQFENRIHARPRKTVFQDAECQAGCGVLPFKYRESQYVNALQWAIGLELFLLVRNPWQVFLTTDHPNGAPFTAYPHLIKLLMDYDFRMEIFDKLHPEVRKWSCLAELKREYTVEEIAVITRAGPAKSLGLLDRIDLNQGSRADVVLFRENANIEHMFSHAELVLRNGEIAWEAGNVKEVRAMKSILRSDVQCERELPSSFLELWNRYSSVPTASFSISDDELQSQNVALEVTATRQV